MLFQKQVVLVALLVGNSAAFVAHSRVPSAFVSTPSKSSSAPHSSGCTCAACAVPRTVLSGSNSPECGGLISAGRQQPTHRAGCICPACTVGVSQPRANICIDSRSSSRTAGWFCTFSASLSRYQLTRLFAESDDSASIPETETTNEVDATAAPTTVEGEVVPTEVVALDGIESAEEAHNSDRPARKTLRKKSPGVGGSGASRGGGKPISEFNVGDTVKAKVKAITSYGAFLDIGSTTDGLLHISQLSVDFVSDVNTVLEMGQEVDVRIINIDAAKGQVALSLLTEEEGESAKQAANRSREARDSRPQRGGGGGGGGSGSNRRDDSAILKQLVEKGWNPEQFVEGTVVSIVDFGAFVRVDSSQLAEGLTGEFDGLVHISALTAGRASSVANEVKVDEKVKVRVKAIADRKVSLTMVSAEDEAAKMEAMGGSGQPQGDGAKDWKESLEKLKTVMPEFKNRPLVLDLRK